jgi:hypothetical protein
MGEASIQEALSVRPLGTPFASWGKGYNLKGGRARVGSLTPIRNIIRVST